MHKTLRLGDKGKEVLTLQQALKGCIAPKLELTGYFGKHTEAAVRQFQERAGFRGKEVDGILGPKTTVALFQMFDVKMKGCLAPSPRVPPIVPTAKPPSPVPSGNGRTVPLPPSPSKPQPPAVNNLPKRLQGNAQFGPQFSRRDGEGLGLQLSMTFRTRDFFPRTHSKHIYDGAHLELLPAFNLGIPVASGSIFTGQLSITIQPLTDLIVIGERWHLFTPQLSMFGQWPINPQDASMGSRDPATHSRLGGTLGGEIFHFDIKPDRLTIGVSAQESVYWDFKDKRIYWDPSVMINLQWTFGQGWQYKPISK